MTSFVHSIKKEAILQNGSPLEFRARLTGSLYASSAIFLFAYTYENKWYGRLKVMSGTPSKENVNILH